MIWVIDAYIEYAHACLYIFIYVYIYICIYVVHLATVKSVSVSWQWAFADLNCIFSRAGARRICFKIQSKQCWLYPIQQHAMSVAKIASAYRYLHVYKTSHCFHRARVVSYRPLAKGRRQFQQNGKRGFYVVSLSVTREESTPCFSQLYTGVARWTFSFLVHAVSLYL